MPALISFQLFPFSQWGFCLFSFLHRFPAFLLQLLGFMPISFISFQLFSFSHLDFCLFSSEVSSCCLSVNGVSACFHSSVSSCSSVNGVDAFFLLWLPAVSFIGFKLFSIIQWGFCLFSSLVSSCSPSVNWVSACFSSSVCSCSPSVFGGFACFLQQFPAILLQLMGFIPVFIQQFPAVLL